MFYCSQTNLSEQLSALSSQSRTKSTNKNHCINFKLNPNPGATLTWYCLKHNSKRITKRVEANKEAWSETPGFPRDLGINKQKRKSQTGTRLWGKVLKCLVENVAPDHKHVLVLDLISVASSFCHLQPTCSCKPLSSPSSLNWVGVKWALL